MDEKKIADIEKDSEIKIETRGRKKKADSGTGSTPQGNFSILDIQEKIYLLFNIPFIILKRKNPYNANDFKNEAESIKRLMNKYAILKNIFNFFDPILLLASIIEKIISLKKDSGNNEQN